MTRRPRHAVRFQRKQYQRRRFQNPYFHHTPPNKWKRFVPSVFLLTSALCFILWIFFGSPLFRFTYISIQGLNKSSSDELRTRLESFLSEPRFLFFHERNRWLFQKEDCQTYLEQFYTFETLTFDFVDLHHLSVTVQEKASSFLWQTTDHTFVVDLQGVVVREITPTEQEWLTTPLPVPSENAENSSDEEQARFLSLPRFRDLNNATVTPGLVVSSPEEISEIFSFQQALLSLAIPFQETQIDRLSGKWVGVLTTAGYLILFDPAGDVTAQAGRLETVLKDSIPDPSTLEYIDLRFGDHVYFK